MFKNFLLKNRVVSILVLFAFLTGFTVAKVDGDFSVGLMKNAARVFGLSFSDAQYEQMIPYVQQQGQSLAMIRGYSLDNHIPPALVFNPLPVGYHPPEDNRSTTWNIPTDVSLPENPNDLAFYSISELASLLRQGLMTSEEMTLFYLQRLEQWGDTLECVVQLLPDRAMKHARRADSLLAAGTDLGPLHGIPYGVKDLFSVDGYKTTWGAVPYMDQMLEGTASVVERLDVSGAVLVAKMSLGALAMGDVWFGGITRNPWDLRQGSSGSSAGSGAAVAAGLLPFALGTETLGSIVSPSTRNGVTGLRPTFGRVSRAGAMALSWSMDKVGPMARSALDCALVFDAIRGVDGLDASLVDAEFYYEQQLDVASLRIGYVPDFFEGGREGNAFDRRVLEDLKSMGLNPEPLEWDIPLPVNALRIILNAEAAAAFDDLTLSGRDTLLVNQGSNAWPNLFRSARMIPAVEYINANRIRHVLIEEMAQLMTDFDVLVMPSYGGNQLLVTNLTGHPCVVAPSGFTQSGHPVSISFIGKLFGEADILSLAQAWQDFSGHHRAHPPMFQYGSAN